MRDAALRPGHDPEVRELMDKAREESRVASLGRQCIAHRREALNPDRSESDPMEWFCGSTRSQESEPRFFSRTGGLPDPDYDHQNPSEGSAPQPPEELPPPPSSSDSD